MTQMNEATLAQIHAADPASSTWVSANAGSGKTRVLTNRVARLLLQGTEPQKILCLTYTKAAAAEMLNRLFARLGDWSMKSDEDLREVLTELGEDPASLDSAQLSRARTLFASALETPGGLKIQTIHSFCERILRRFPLEAGVSPQFKVLEERQAKTLRAEVLDDLSVGPNADVVKNVGHWLNALDPDDLLRAVTKHSKALLIPVEPSRFNISGDETVEGLWSDNWSASDIDDLRTIAKLGSQTKKTDQKAAADICAALDEPLALDRFQLLEKTVLIGSGPNMGLSGFDSNSKFPTKEFKETFPAEAERLRSYFDRISDTQTTRLAIPAYQRATILHAFAKLFVADYQHRKSMLSVLDFDDQINRTADLLTTQNMASWVLYKLDGGIDHILVDEAQDTSPAQWRVIRQLSAEFTGGQGSRETDRTIFVVGDQKQSIYSFQGADPDAFDEMRGFFKKQLANIETHLNEQDLLFSFRSAMPILELVDKVADTNKSGLPASVKHTPFWDSKAGCVDLWPFIDKEEKPEGAPWFTPLDRAAPNDPQFLLAKKIATFIKDVLQSGRMLEIEGELRPARAGDFLILVQGRSVLFNAIIKALKAKGLPVAGADRLRIAEELAVKDILALLRFMTLPEDSLSLAEALRSPLFSVSEARLFSLAYDRGKRSLWQVLRNSAEFEEERQILSDLLKGADFDRPYDLIERVLGKYQGRENLLARLGVEAEDAIDELLNQAMNYEQIEPPTLTGFLEWFASGDVEVKRQLDSDADLIRVMTVHGAKGLEAPVVILPDTAPKKSGARSLVLIEGEDSNIHWRSGAAEETAEETAAKAFRSAKDKAENARLLYVALTRAENWLIVCGAGERGKKEPNCWYDYVAEALTALGVKEQQVDGETLHRFCNDGWKNQEFGKQWQPPSEAQLQIPDWVATPAAKLSRAQRPIAPSALPGAKALSGVKGRQADIAMELGTVLHHLLEILPNVSEPKRRNAGIGIAENSNLTLPDDEKIALVDHACDIISNPDLAHIFGENSFTEVAITARIKDLNDRAIEGTIDRLIVEENKVTVVDFKSNQTVPIDPSQIPEGVLRQIAVYFDAVQQIYPDHIVEAQILWTEAQRLMTVPHILVKETLIGLGHLDDLKGHEYLSQ